PGATALGTAVTQFAAQVHAALAGGPAPDVGALTAALGAFDPGNAGGSIGRSRRLQATLSRARTAVGRPGFADDLARYASHQSLPEVQTGRLTWRPRIHDPSGIFKPR